MIKVKKNDTPRVYFVLSLKKWNNYHTNVFLGLELFNFDEALIGVQS